jgi:hypothetical protein
MFSRRNSADFVLARVIAFHGNSQFRNQDDGLFDRLPLPALDFSAKDKNLGLAAAVLTPLLLTIPRAGVRAADQK